MKKQIKRYLGNYTDRVIALSVVSVVINLVSAIAKLIMGIDLLSLWYIVNGVYYVTLVAARIVSISTYYKVRHTLDDSEKDEIESKFYRRSGLFIFLLAAVYLWLCVFMFTRQYAVVAEGYGVYIVVFIVLYKLVFSIYGLYVVRKMKDKVTETLKTISVTDAGVSLVTALVTILNLVDGTIAVKTSAALGIVISFAFMATGTVMTVTRTRNYRKNRISEQNEDNS